MAITHSSDFANFDVNGMMVNDSSVDAVEPFDVWTEAKGYALRTAPGREFSQAGKSVTITWTVNLAAYPETPTRVAKIHWIKGHWGNLSIKVEGIGPNGKPTSASTSVSPGPNGA